VNHSLISDWLPGILFSAINLFFLVWSLDEAIRRKNRRALFFSVLIMIILTLTFMTMRGEL